MASRTALIAATAALAATPGALAGRPDFHQKMWLRTATSDAHLLGENAAALKLPKAGALPYSSIEHSIMMIQGHEDEDGSSTASNAATRDRLMAGPVVSTGPLSKDPLIIGKEPPKAKRAGGSSVTGKLLRRLSRGGSE